jgi:hypothetical protein
VKVFSVFSVVANCRVATFETHVTNLALSGVTERTIRLPTIVLTVLLSALSSEQQNQGVTDGRADASLFLSAVLTMNL